MGVTKRPDNKSITKEDWNALVDYYLTIKDIPDSIKNLEDRVITHSNIGYRYVDGLETLEKYNSRISDVVNKIIKESMGKSVKMNSKEQEVIDTDENVVKSEVKRFENSHLVMSCSKCGGRYILEENIPKNGGIQILLPPTASSNLTLKCKDCNNEMSLFYVEAVKKDNPEVKEKTNESISEGSTTETTVV
jgi:ribosomal protein S27E